MGRRKTHEEFINEMIIKNPNIDILGRYVTSKTKIECKCKVCGEEWQSEPRRLSFGQGCPSCAGNKKKTHEEFANELLSVNPNLTLLGEYKRLYDKIKVKCNICNYIWNAKCQSLRDGHNCPKCADKLRGYNARKTHEQFLTDLFKINKNIEVLEKYVDNKTKIKCKCKKCNNIWMIRPNNLLNGHNCPKCCYGALKTQEKFEEDMKKSHPEISVIGNYINSKEKIECECLLCGKTFFAQPTHLLSSTRQGCNTCIRKQLGKEMRKTHEEFVNELNNVDSNIEVVGEYHLATEKILCKCIKCNKEWYMTPDKLLQGYGCPICNISLGEKRIMNYLITNNIKYVLHKTYNDLKGVNNGNLSYDFHIPSYNLLIEFQGVQHESPIDFFGGDRTFEIQKEHDKRKREYADRHNIKLLEIWYYDKNNIENILFDCLYKQLGGVL